jgi:histidine ammonia-lyase
MKELEFIISPDKLALTDVKNILSKNLKLKLSNKSIERISTNRNYLDRKLNRKDQVFYGINTGFGSLCDTRIPENDLKKLQVNLVRSHACGSGKEIDSKIVKLMILIKINALSLGYSGVHLKTVEKLIFLFNNDILPVVFESGSLGASGDLAPLAHLSLALIGEGEVNFKGSKSASKDVFESFGESTLELDSKEGLALLNGTQFMSAHATYSYLKLDSLFNWIHKISALSIDVFNCRLSPFDSKPHLLRGFKGQSQCAQQILEILDKSDLHQIHGKSVQDPYSFRCIPQVHGASLDVLHDFKTKLTIEINAVTDNPLVFNQENEIISAGNFHGQPIAMAMDFMAIAAAELGSISERRIYKLISGTRGLPAFLIENPGLNSGFMISQYTAASLVSKNKIFSHPASVDSIESSNGQEDHVSMGSIAGVKLVEVVENVKRILSIELMTAAQAMEFRRPRKTSPELELMLSDFRSKVPFIEKDQVMYSLMQKSEEFISKQL